MEVAFTNRTIYDNFAESIFSNKGQSRKKIFCKFLLWKFYAESTSCYKILWTKKVLPSETTAEFVTII